MNQRLSRVEETVRRALADILLRGELRDPRLRNVAAISITAVKISPDLGQAQVYVDVLGEEASLQDVIAGLNAGASAEVTPTATLIGNANYIQFVDTAPLETILGQRNISNEAGIDLSLGVEYRPFLNNNIIVKGFGALFQPLGIAYIRQNSLTVNFRIIFRQLAVDCVKRVFAIINQI